MKLTLALMALLILSACGTTRKVMKNCEHVDGPNWLCEQP